MLLQPRAVSPSLSLTRSEQHLLLALLSASLKAAHRRIRALLALVTVATRQKRTRGASKASALATAVGSPGKASGLEVIQKEQEAEAESEAGVTIRAVWQQVEQKLIQYS